MILYVVIAFFFIVYSFYILINKKAELGIGRPPIFSINLEGAPANIHGLSLLFGSILFGLPDLLFLFGVRVDYLTWLSTFGVMIIILGGIFSIMLQSSIIARKPISKKQIRDENSNNEA